MNSSTNLLPRAFLPQTSHSVAKLFIGVLVCVFSPSRRHSLQTFCSVLFVSREVRALKQ